jgi:proline iminopeptidase
VEEVEQVRKALKLNKDNFFLMGQSWGGILAMEYALKYQEHLKGLIISNMMSSTADYNKYVQEVLGPQMDPEILKEIEQIETNNDFTNPRYMELLMEHYYPEHFMRLPLEEWPEAVNRAFKHMNQEVYVHMQGYSEFGIKGNATLKDWDLTKDLSRIYVPTLTIGATYDTMDPEHMEWMSEEVQNGRFLLCPDGSHGAQWDDQKVYFKGLIEFLRDVDSNNF